MFCLFKKNMDQNFRCHRTELYPASWLVPEHLGSLRTRFGSVWSVSALPGWDSEQKPDVRQSNSIDTSTQLLWRRSTYPFNRPVSTPFELDQSSHVLNNTRKTNYYRYVVYFIYLGQISELPCNFKELDWWEWPVLCNICIDGCPISVSKAGKLEFETGER